MESKVEAEAIWDLFVASRSRTDVDERVLREIGGAAKRLFPNRYRRFHERRWADAHPGLMHERYLERSRRWRAANPEKVAANNQRQAERWVTRHGVDARREYDRAYYEKNRDRVLTRQRALDASRGATPRPGRWR